MKSTINPLATALLATAGMVFNGPATGSGDEAAVRAATDDFYNALNAMFTGDLDPMKSVWSHADDVTYMGPAGGLKVGWAQVLADWEAQAARRLGGEVRPGRLHVFAGSGLAVVVNQEVGRNIPTDTGPVNVDIRATNVFRLEGGHWKMIGHHTDILPFLQQ